MNIVSNIIVVGATLQDLNREASDFVTHVGAFIMFIGALKIAESVKSDDPNAKAGGAGLLFAGFLVILICTNLIPLL